MNIQARENNMQRGNGSGHFSQFMEAVQRPFVKSVGRYSTILFVVIVLLVGALFPTRFFDTATFMSSLVPVQTPMRQQTEIPLNCAAVNLTGSCPTNYPTMAEEDLGSSANATCPDYFRWIHEDLRPWAYTGITIDMIQRANRTAHFRLVVVNGKAYVEKYEKAFQTRDVFTLWGILQLLRKYPGKVPDFDLMFQCMDQPAIRSRDYGGPNNTTPPPLFAYCKDEETLDIVFPDWSFWGWPEINIKSWVPLLNDLMEGNQKMKWEEREPYAYWKGNPKVSRNSPRKELVKCNVSAKRDWGARIYSQNWIRESQQGFKESDLANQCKHRFKIYIEGNGWSVSEKYILACDSLTLLVKPRYYDFFSRSLVPMRHYWPIRSDDKCRSIKHAVDWGNSHPQEAQAIGKAANEFIKEDLKIDYVYDYMFHLLNEYAKLLKYKPSVPRNAIELCSEIMACPAKEFLKKFMIESMVKGPSVTSPCTMPTPYVPASLNVMLTKRENTIKQVEEMEKKFWEKQI